jgi:hypothetical protein
METLNHRDKSALERFKGRLGCSDVRRDRSVDLVQQVGPFRHRADGALKSLDGKQLAAQVCLEERPTLDVGVMPMIDNTPHLCTIAKQLDFWVREAPPKTIGMEGDPERGTVGCVE